MLGYREPRSRSVGPVLAAMAAVASLVLIVPAAQASVEHPKLVVSAETEKTGKKVPLVGWAQVQLNNRFLGTLECVLLGFGNAQNETEPGGQGNSEDVRGYGELLEGQSNAFANASGGGLTTGCKSSNGVEAYLGELKPHLTTEVANSINGAATERLVIKGPFGSANSHRESEGFPWKLEVTAESVGGVEHSFLKTGVAMTERAAVEAEEAAAGVPTERRTGCYHEPPITEIVRQPGYIAPKETELAVKEAPKGCVRVNVIAPSVGIETAFVGSMEPQIINGTRNALTPSHVEFKGGFIGTETEIPSERSSERNERALIGAFGAGYTRSITPLKLIGYRAEELLQVK